MRRAKMAQSKSSHYGVSMCVLMFLFVGSLNAECCTEGETKGDEDDCTKYLVCCQGEFKSKSCENGLYWESEKGECAVDNGECKPPTCENGTIVANPDDCAGFLECVNGTIVIVSCPDGEYFDSAQNNCVPDTCGACINCTEGSTKADLNDCAKFQVCVNGKYVSKTCPVGDYWNSLEHKCQKDDGQCNGTPGCKDGELEVDPTDCAGYLSCSNGTFVSVKCPEGNYFNTIYKTCVPDTEGICVNCTEGTQKPEPTDCTKYQVCSGGKFVTKSCETDYYYNNKTARCEEDDGQCKGNGTTCTDGDVKVDPTDCAGYLSCSNGTFVNVKCAEGNYFNTIYKNCVPDTDGVCVNCTEGTQKPEPTDCTKYQVCSGGKFVTKSCETDYYYNNKTARCEEDDGQCKGNGTTCTDGDVKVDPTDCAGYLSCSNGSFVSVKCDEGNYFNTIYKTCVPDTEGVCVKCTEGAIKENPSDCAGYLQCINGKYVARKCSASMFFNVTKQECVVDTDGVCIPKTCDPDCCDVPNNSIWPVEKNCSAFFQCVNGNKFEQRCSNNLQYNNKTEQCDYPENVGCDDGSAPPSGPTAGPSGTYCESHGRCVGQRDGTMFADASGKCSSAYVVCQCECEVDMSCFSGLWFNKQINSCDWPDNVKC
ncbi:chitin-binding domain protein cbd-1-like [Drosophila gunungcola]|uniref:chitin-binding domain protein cbd-1-like n=1 Tax=Drosophila gunungcola TaxID=103775 RepID=UPI0022E269C3|nr:chitin-binding domain protein cbd-1-like [Drosophila gunungcola]